MSEGITTNLDYSKLNSRIEELHDAIAGQGGDASTIFHDESRLFGKQIIRLTPPKNRQQGEAAIDRDLMKLFEPVNADWLDDLVIAHGHNNLDEWITTAGGGRKHLKWTYLDNTGGPMNSFHNDPRNRDSRGRAYNLKRQRDPSTWYAPYVVGYDKFTEYAKRVKSHVGRRKAAWAKSFEALGGSVASWIHRHVAGAKGEFRDNSSPSNPSITMINRAPGIMDDLHFVRGALRVRLDATMRRFKLVVSGYSKDVAHGLKVQRHAHKTAESFSEAS